MSLDEKMRQKLLDDGLTPEEIDRSFGKDTEAPGPTGEFPQGKLNPQDDGELTIKIGRNLQQKIIMEFGIPVAWIGLDPPQAIAIGRDLLRHGKKALKKRRTMQ